MKKVFAKFVGHNQTTELYSTILTNGKPHIATTDISPMKNFYFRFWDYKKKKKTSNSVAIFPTNLSTHVGILLTALYGIDSIVLVVIDSVIYRSCEAI